ncbi:MAG: DUF4292 domain-containing protein [Bacteroidia bacterium]
MNKKVSYFLAFILIVTVTGCKTKKAIQKPVTDIPAEVKPNRNEYFVKKARANENAFNYFSAKGEAEYKDQKDEQNFNVFIVMEKDEYIWMSITALLGIEVARVRLTPDSLVMLDRLHRICIITNYGFLKKFTGMDLNLKNIQQLIIGNAAFDADEKTSVCDTSLTGIIIYSILQDQKQVAEYNTNFRLQKNTIGNRTDSKQFKVEYASHQKHGNNEFPSQIHINIRAEKNVECKFSLTNFVFEKKKDVPFSIPANYEIVKP